MMVKAHHILQVSAPLPLDWRMGEFDMVSWRLPHIVRTILLMLDVWTSSPTCEWSESCMIFHMPPKKHKVTMGISKPTLHHLLHSPVMEPGWSPLPTDEQPYFQVDFLEPTWVSGLVTQGSERMWGYLTKYRLAFALHSSLFHDYTEDGKPDGPAKVCELVWTIADIFHIKW